MKLKKIVISALIFICTASLFALEQGQVFTSKFKTGDQLEYSLRGKLCEYDSIITKNNIIYYIISCGNDSQYDIKIDDFIFRLKKGDKFLTYVDKKGTAENLLQSYFTRYYLSEEITAISDNQIEITYTVTKVEKYLKGKGIKGDYELVTKYPWE